MSLGDHLEELRLRLVLAIGGLLVGLVVCLFFGKDLMVFISGPYDWAMAQAGRDSTLTVIQPAEAFMVYLKTCLLFGLIVSSPWVFYQIWAFVSAGLYKTEKKYVRIIVPASAILFAGGSVFFIKAIGPMAMLFFVKFNPGVFVAINFTLQNYIGMMLALTLVFGLAFQMPILIICLEKIGIVPLSALVRVRKFVILGLVVAAAIVTPPDVISQISLAVPLYALYEASIIICWITGRRKKG